MKKLFFIALFAIGLTTTMSAQSYTSHLDGPDFILGEIEINNDFYVDLTTNIVSVDVSSTEYTESISYFYSVGGGNYLSHTELYAGSDVYNFIVEKNSSNNIVWLDIWVD